MEAIRESTTAQVRRVLSDRILNGDLVPGTRLREMHIASEFRISQGPVREALRELEVLGLVQIEPYKGASVREVTKQDLREAYILRSALEELAGRLAAPYLKGKVGQLEEMAAHIQSAATKKDLPGYVKYDVSFHRTIVEATGNRLLLRAWDALGFEVRMQIRLANSTLNLVEVQKEHWPIIRALDKGDGALAGDLLQKHIFRRADSARSKRA